MKKILIIANQFPPCGGGGVIRVLKFVKYLPSFGWEPFVLTRDFSKNLVFRDESLLEELPSDVKVFRVASLEPLGLTRKLKELKNENGNSNKNGNHFSLLFNFLKKVRDIIFHYILIPDQDILWVKRAIKKAEKIIQEEGVDTIFSTSPPDSTHLIGYFLKTKYPNLKWITDYRDIWYFRNGYSASIIRKKMYLYLEKKMINHSDGTTLVHNIIQNVDKSSPKIALIPNGYDEDDFKTIGNGLKKDIFTLTYAGSILGYRQNQCLLEGIKLLKESGKGEHLQINLFGAIDEKYIDKINKFNLKDIVKIINFETHKTALERLSKSHAILFIQTNNKEEAIVPSGKIYEYLRTGKPVFALVQNGIVKDLINRFNAGIAVDPDNPQEISEGLNDLIENYEKYIDLRKNESEFLKRYERKELTRQLSELLNSIQK